MSRRTVRAVLHSRALLLVGLALTLAVPVLTVPRLPHLNPWPATVGLALWVVGKYLCCPLRWHALTPSGFSRRWHIRAYAESELLGMLTPGHVGADLWRVTRLTHHGFTRGHAIASVALDRSVGAIGLTVFVVFAGPQIPVRVLLLGLGAVALVVAALLVLRAKRPEVVHRWPLPSRRRVLAGFALSALYQLSIAAFLVGAVAATGHDLGPMRVLAAFGVSQLAAFIPGPQGASPRDGALVAALVGFGLPLTAAAAAVAIKGALSWFPALALGGPSLLSTRRQLRRRASCGGEPAQAATGDQRPQRANPHA